MRGRHSRIIETTTVRNDVMEKSMEDNLEFFGGKKVP